MTKTILLIIGTRPEAIKMAPVYEQLKKSFPEINVKVLATGQHIQLLDDGLLGFNMEIDLNLNLQNSTNSVVGFFAKLMDAVADALESYRPDLVLVHGDTTTAACAAIAAHLVKIPVGHVEAGLRSFRLDAPFPEEANRRLVDSVTTLFFAPTDHAANQISKDRDSKVYVTGNTVLDALKSTHEEIYSDEARVQSYKTKYKFLGEDFILVTQHRRESFGDKHQKILDAIKNLASATNQVVFPVHPNPSIREQVHKALGNTAFIHLVEPVPYPDFVFLMSQAKLAISDSGGIQEEAPSLGLPLLITRNVTERPEALEASTNKLVGSNSQLIGQLGGHYLNLTRTPSQGIFTPSIFGDGTAGILIATRCAEFLEEQSFTMLPVTGQEKSRLNKS